MRKIKDPSVKQNKKKLPLHPFELVWYTLTGLVGIWGITYIVLGLVARYLPITDEDKGLVKVNGDFAKTFKLDFFGWGLIILAIFKDEKILLVRESDGRWAMPGGWCDVNMSPAENVIKEAKEEAEQSEVIDAEVEPVKEEPKAEEEKPEEPVEEKAE